jgi:hypothetical protein
LFLERPIRAGCKSRHNGWGPLVRSSQPVQEGPPRASPPEGLRLARYAPPDRGRSGFSLHRTGMMAMLHGLRGRTPPAMVSLTSFSFRPRCRPENALLSGLFSCTQRCEDDPGRAHGPVNSKKAEPLVLASANTERAKVLLRSYPGPYSCGGPHLLRVWAFCEVF